MNIVENRKLFFAISGGLVLVAVILLLVNGLNFGIDFAGGTLLERGLPAGTTAAQVQEVLASEALASLDLGGSFVQPLDEAVEGQTVVIIRTRAEGGTAAIEQIDQALRERFGEVTIRRTELVGPVIGRELVRNALLALVVAGVGMLIYISLRFEYRFGLAAVLGIAHDVLIALGVLALVGRELNTPFIAGILTVVGYSINNTIVVFDRIRENQRLNPRKNLVELVNSSIHQTLARQINTSLTTLFAVVALYFFGGSTIKDFTLTLLVGIVAGTYSSIFVVGALWMVLRERMPARAAKSA